MAELRRPSLPTAVWEALEEYQAAGRPQHPALAQGMLQGYLPDPSEWPDGAEDKLWEALKQRENLQRFHQEDQHHDLLDRIAQRLDVLTGPGRVVRSEALRLRTRTVIGIGLPNQLETGFLLHPLYGVPYLPGSALKGVAQSYLLRAYAGEAGVPHLSRPQFGEWQAGNKQDPTPLERFERLLLTPTSDESGWQWQLNGLEATLGRLVERSPRLGECVEIFRKWRGQPAARERAQAYRTLFGAPPLSAPPSGRPAQRGRVVFFDALPDRGSRGNWRLEIEVDVLTPHYMPYYQADPPVPPGDYFDPVPVPFLVIARGSAFRIAVLAGNQATAELALQVVRRALSEWGIGAKTSSGYGRFRAQD